MKPFDLVKALAGAPVVTRDGRKVEQLVKFSPNGCIYLGGVLCNRRPNGDELEWWRSDGSAIGNGEEHLDLFMSEPEKVKREGWINIYSNESGGHYAAHRIFEGPADAWLNTIPGCVATTRIEWEEEAR